MGEGLGRIVGIGTISVLVRCALRIKRCRVEFHLFLTALSVLSPNIKAFINCDIILQFYCQLKREKKENANLPGRYCEILAQELPNCFCIWIINWSSSGVQPARLIFGSRWLYHLFIIKTATQKILKKVVQKKKNAKLYSFYLLF